MSLVSGFNAEKVAPMGDFSPIPAGVYTAMITKSEEKQSQKGGSFLSLTFQVIEGDYKGRLIFNNLNLEHSNPKVVAWAEAELSSICRACGELQIDYSSQLHNIPIAIHVGIQPPKDGYDAANRIKKYEPVAGATKQPSPQPAESFYQDAPADECPF